MKRALVFGGAGQIGAAAALVLHDAGWQVAAVTTGERDLPQTLQNCGISHLDGSNMSRCQTLIQSGLTFDAIIDPTAYNPGDAADLLDCEAKTGAFVVLSSSSVYADAEGRSLDEARDTGFPELPFGIAETTATVAPGPETYSTRKVAMEKALGSASVPVVILRPCAVYGRHARALREAWFLKRVFDGRPQIPVAHAAKSKFHTSSTVGIATLIACILEKPADTILNVADPEAISVADIAASIEMAIDRSVPLLPLDGDPQGTVGGTPWSVPRPYVLDVSKALATGWDGSPHYTDAVKDVCQWAVACAAETSWADAFPLHEIYGVNVFDYEAEDKVLAALGA